MKGINLIILNKKKKWNTKKVGFDEKVQYRNLVS